MVASAFIFFISMIDNNLTIRLKTWLENGSHTDNEDIMEGAQMLLKLNRNQALFNTISRRPEKYVSKIEYELKKFLPMRLNRMTIGDVKKLDAELTPAIQDAINNETGSADDELNEKEDLPAHGGKRSDHDSLPDDIKSIWEENAIRWKKIKLVFNQLKTLTQPCDRYELLMQLKETWYKYKADFERYDSFEPNPAPNDGESDPSEVIKQITNARAYISKNIDKLQQLKDVTLSENPSDKDIEKYNKLCKSLRERLSLLLDNSQVVGDDVLTKLAEGGVEIEKATGDDKENESKSDTEAPGD